MLSGIINVYKEKGYTSFDVVAKLRGILKTRKIGHAGTLDPDAEGVLPVCVGKATKACGLLSWEGKEYETVMLLGTVTDTQDISGTVLRQAKAKVSGEEVCAAAQSFVGTYLQVPPMYSALKVGGKRLYELARAGVSVEREARPVHIFSLEVLEIQLPRVRIRVECSKGTYIRTLCEDIGEKLGCGACMESLVRTRACGFAAEDAFLLSQIEALVGKEAGNVPPGQWDARMFSFMMPVDSIFREYVKATVKGEFTKVLRNGNPLSRDMFESIGAGDADTPKQNGVPDVGEGKACVFENGGSYGECITNADMPKQNQVPNGDNVRTCVFGSIGAGDADTPKQSAVPDGGAHGEGRIRVYDAERHFIGIYAYAGEEGHYKPVKMFLEE